MKKRINIGVIGIGRMGSIYVGHLVQRIANANLIAVADLKEKLAESYAQKYNIPRWYPTHQDLVNDKNIEAVIVATPTNTHREVVVAAATHHKAIFCEKPMSLSLAEAQEMQQAVEQSGLLFQIGFMRRFDKGYMAAKQKIDQGVIGTPVVYKASSRDPYRPSLEYADPGHSGGLVTDMAIHDFDIGRWFMGEVKSVYSIGGTLAYPEMKQIGDIDNAITNIYFDNGTLGVVDVSRNGVYGYDIRAEVLGTKGTLKIGYLRETPILVMTREGITHDTVPFFMERFSEAYLAQIQNFIDSIQNDRMPSLTAADGIAALQISLAATASRQENRPIEMHHFLSNWQKP